MHDLRPSLPRSDTRSSPLQAAAETVGPGTSLPGSGPSLSIDEPDRRSQAPGTHTQASDILEILGLTMVCPNTRRLPRIISTHVPDTVDEHEHCTKMDQQGLEV